MSDELSRRERKKLETEMRLLDAAWTLFREKGFDATTVEEITAAAGVAKGTFFNYFASKEDMLGPLAAWRMRQLLEDVNAAAERDAGKETHSSALTQIKVLLIRISQDLFPDSDLARRTLSLHLCRRADRDGKPPFPLWSVFVDLVRKAQKQGEIRADVDPRFVAKVLMTCGFRDAWRRYGAEEERPAIISQDAEADVEHNLAVLVEGLAGPKWRLE